MQRLSNKTLITLIVILSTAIIIISVLLFSKNGFPFVNNSPKPPMSTQEESIQKPPIVVIDAGHGGWEPGAGNGTINEKDIVLDLSLEIEKLLKEKNIDYYMTRNDDTYVSLEDRVRIANEKSSKLFVSIHNNSFTDSSQSGILTTYNPYSPNGKEIAEIMQSKINNLGMRDRAVMPRPNLYVLRHTEMPAILLEIGFISNKKDLKLLKDINFQHKCAKQIVLGIEEIISKHIPESVTGVEESPEED